MNNNPWSNPANPSGPKSNMLDKLLDFAKNNLILSIGAGFLLASGGLYLIANHFIIIAAGLVFIGLINLIKPKSVNILQSIKSWWKDFDCIDHPIITFMSIMFAIALISVGIGYLFHQELFHQEDLKVAKQKAIESNETLVKQEIAGKVTEVQYHSDYQVIKTDLGGLLVSYPFSTAVGATVTIKYWQRGDGKKAKSISFNGAENGVYLKNEQY